MTKRDLYESLKLLARQMNYKGTLDERFLSTLVNVLKRYSENEQFVFLSEAPSHFKSFPKAADIKQFFIKNPIKKFESNSYFKKSDCYECKDDGFIERHRGKVACICPKGIQLLRQGKALAPRYFKPCPWPNKWQAVAEAANRLDEKSLRGAKRIIQGLTDDHIMSILDAYKNNRWTDKLAGDAMRTLT